MITQRTQAEILAACLEYEVTDVSTAIAWADQEIAASGIPHNALCDVSMASRASGHDVASMLRNLPGDIQDDVVLHGVIEQFAEALRHKRRSPHLIGKALFHMAMEDMLPPGDLQDGAWWFYDAIDLAEYGHISENFAQVVKQMQDTLDRWLAEQRSLSHP